MIINHFTDNDLYKFTTMNAIQKLYPEARVKYSFFNRDDVPFPPGFATELRKEVDSFSALSMTNTERKFITSRCYYFDNVFIDLLNGYRYNPEEVNIDQQGEKLVVEIEGLWYRTVLWEVPLLALISELYFIMDGKKPQDAEKPASFKAKRMKEIHAEYSEFGTRRRFSFDVQGRVIKTLKANSGDLFKGTSNLYFAMQYNLVPIGTHPHEWFMYHASQFGYRSAISKALDAWVDVYKGALGIALSDTLTSDNFFSNFSVLHAKLFDGIRQDSGDPLVFTDKAVEFYRKNKIDPGSKTIVFSDSLDLNKVSEIKKYVNGRIHDVYGIGTYLSNDVGLKPLNIVIKLTYSKQKASESYYPAIKLSDDEGKHTGEPEEIKLCKRIINLKTIS